MESSVLILHYHIYKNGGSTIIKNFKRYFGEYGFVSIDKLLDFQKNNTYDWSDVNVLLQKRKNLKAISSHNFIMDMHVKENSKFLAIPILFIRQPLLRVASAYRYEKIRLPRNADYDQANKLNFNEWLQTRMTSSKYIACDNFQCRQIAQTGANLSKNTQLPTLKFENIKHKLDQIPIVGLVEYYKKSIDNYNNLIQRHYPNFSFDNKQHNKTKNTNNWNEELKTIESSISKEVLYKFKARNTEDYKLFWYTFDRLINKPIDKQQYQVST